MTWISTTPMPACIQCGATRRQMREPSPGVGDNVFKLVCMGLGCGMEARGTSGSDAVKEWRRINEVQEG